MSRAETIIALSSGAPPSGVAVIRLSGPACRDVAIAIFGAVPPPRRLDYGPLRLDGVVLDRGLVAFFPAPHSVTGEDCLEFHTHGSPAVVRALLRGLVARPGVRLAEAGEFTRRAFENGKLDLVEVEGLGDLLAAETESQRALAQARMAGALTQQIAGWRESLLDLRAEFEARLDFSDESDVPEALPAAALAKLAALQDAFADALAGIERGRITREGARIALAGPPNAGKSSLLNALAKSDLAIVTPEAGTTRDVKEVNLDLNGHLVVLVDMAGLRETDSLAEAEGVRRAHVEIERADLVLWLVAPDVDAASTPPMPMGDRGASPGAGVGVEAAAPLWRIGTKADLGAARVPVDLSVSVKTGQGLTELAARLGAFVAEHAGRGSVLFSRERDRVALGAARDAVGAALAERDRLELAAEQLRRASAALERLVGRIDAEAVLGRLFAGFCIGK